MTGKMTHHFPWMGSPPVEERTEVRHLVVLVPGFGGSELRDAEGRVVWGLSPRAVGQPVRVAERLIPVYEDLADPDFSDGLRPGGLVGAGVPGLFRSLGYATLVHSLESRFALDPELTYLQFTYDWRRPIAVSAAELGRAVERRLRIARARVNPRAQVIVLAYSMGGLVARQYLEHEGGHRDCRRLITLGSPYRGSLKALDFLANGPKLRAVRLASLAEHIRRLPSFYELLPTYPIVQDRRPEAPAALLRVKDIVDAVPGLDGQRIREAWSFLSRLNQSAQPHLTEPWAGYGQPTLQRAVLTSSGLRVDRSSEGIPASYGRTGGDGTVPSIAARPVSHGEHHLTVVEQPQTHSGFVAADETVALVLENLWRYLRDDDPVQFSDIRDPRDTPGGGPAGWGGPTIGLEVEDIYDRDEVVAIPGRLAEGAAGTTIWYRLDGGERLAVHPDSDGAFVLHLGRLPLGTHRVDLVRGRSERSFLSDAVEVW
ncbi:triacylglycerol lipase [Frankia sp. CiP3]|uniref:esterase/lipase family protein n=1 Tax=Frankia sp. CiP3 TaxID=2880971 RepID=UPI001EF63B76|nr:hypothetical protein [Frankia sp. CiP3]